jgi:tRNA A37 methylthiotransferase MiaB
VCYDNAYIFKYSPRPGTDAAAREDDVPLDIKEARHQRLLALQEGICERRHWSLEGTQVQVLIEGPGKRGGQWFGRTRGNHGVIVPACRADCEHHGRGLSAVDARRQAGAGRPARAPGDGADGEHTDDLTGRLIDVMITSTTAHTLFATMAASSPAAAA